MSGSMITMFAYAKVNLALAISGLREDQYHELESVMQSVELHDVVRVGRRGSGLVCHCGSLSGPQNLAYQAANLFLQRWGRQEGIEIEITKHIPVEAGLAGGSSDAAAVLRALNRLFGFPYTPDILREMAAALGADVPFCLAGGTMWATGRGEVLEALPAAPALPLVLVKPRPGVNTEEVYRRWDWSGPRSRLKREDWQAVLRRPAAAKVAALLSNALEPAAIELVPAIAEIKAKLLRAGCLGALMSGSGSAVFGLAESDSRAQEIAKNLGQDQSWQIWVTRFQGENSGEVDLR
ncbi:4-diphosphocytidyl-2-C-methyl-D-erythritol kinase [Peptococcaceae bacterium CEB3]|nr:4-diphosphocytidyl-2-C-methyl-D-erythritol kinase [Peptococcaceae bacterium CEB3]